MFPWHVCDGARTFWFAFFELLGLPPPFLLLLWRSRFLQIIPKPQQLSQSRFAFLQGQRLVLQVDVMEHSQHRSVVVVVVGFVFPVDLLLLLLLTEVTAPLEAKPKRFELFSLFRSAFCICNFLLRMLWRPFEIRRGAGPDSDCCCSV